jgi:hypothetical protein
MYPAVATACGNATGFVEDSTTAVLVGGQGNYGEAGVGYSGSAPISPGNSSATQNTYLGPYNTLLPTSVAASPASGEGNVNDGSTWASSSPQTTRNYFAIDFGTNQYIWGLELDSDSTSKILGSYAVYIATTTGSCSSPGSPPGHGSGWTEVASSAAGDPAGAEYMQITFPVQNARCALIAPTGTPPSTAWYITYFYAYE